MDKAVYADNAATTSLRRAALDAMLPWLGEDYGNASALYLSGRRARKAVENARGRVAELLGADKDEIFFTSGGTEGDNAALMGLMDGNPRRHIVASAIEHPAVLRTLEELERRGCEVSYVMPDGDGIIAPEAVEAALRKDTALVSVMAVNNELGTCQPIGELASLSHSRGARFHTDAVQAAGHMPLALHSCGADIATISAHKFGGPKGCGAMYIKRGTEFSPFILGGGQERGMRSGTENVAGIVGLSAALELAVVELDEVNERLREMRRALEEGIRRIPGSRQNGGGENALPGIISFSFEGVEGENVATLMGQRGVYVSPGSACASGQHEPSHVLRAIGLPEPLAKGGVRISLGRDNRREEVPRILEALEYALTFLRRISPDWRD